MPQIAKEDLYYPHPLLQDVLWWALYQAEGLLVGSSLRKRALAHVMEHIHYEVPPPPPPPFLPPLTPNSGSLRAVWGRAAL